MTTTRKNNPQKNIFESILETVESLVIAFILAFVFRAFIVEAFVIPTGSMADTLRGAHFRMVCPRCGHQYNYGFIPENYGLPKGYVPNKPLQIVRPEKIDKSSLPRCPLCGQYIDNGDKYYVSNGDRILVLKYIYQLEQPSRWDVVVFKSPEDPHINFIKRLIGKPGEKLEIIDGDVYINDEIQRKPDRIQETLWLTMYDHNHQPRNIEQYTPYGPWPRPFVPTNRNSAWRTGQPETRRLEFAGSESDQTLVFDPKRLKQINDFAAYNGQQSASDFTASDIRIEGVLTPAGDNGSITFYLGKYGRTYQGTIDFAGALTLSEEKNRTLESPVTRTIKPLQTNQPVLVSFSVVDHRLQLSVGAETLVWDGPPQPYSWGYESIRSARIPPTVSLSGKGGAFSLDSVKLFRDTHYTNSAGQPRFGLGTEGNPVTLKEHEFFVLGDNSPQSHDSRFWGSGEGNWQDYRPGIVPRDYMIGKAFFVYWPSGYRYQPFLKYPVIPNVGNMRFIY